MDVCVQFKERRVLFSANSPVELLEKIVQKFGIDSNLAISLEVNRKGFGWVETDFDNIRNQDEIKVTPFGYHVSPDGNRSTVTSVEASSP